MFKTLPKWLKISVICLFIILILFDAWYFYLLKYAPSKTVLTTFNVSTLDKIEGNDNYIVEFNYYANEDKTGVELVELKLKYITNENTTDTMEVGVQLVGQKDKSINSILGKYKHLWDTTGLIVGTAIGGPLGFLIGASVGGANFYASDFQNCDVYKYNKYNNLSYKATSEIDANSAFLITMNNESFLMSFKGEQTSELMVDKNGAELSNCFIRYDANYLIMKLFEAVKNSNMTNGTYYTKFEFKENLFNYQKSTGNNVFEDAITDTAEMSKVKEKVMNYFTIKINSHKRGAVMASDSLFGMIKNQTTFNLTSNTDINNYHSKQQAINLNEYSFDYLKAHDNYSNLQLSEATKKDLAKYSNCLLKITINLDNLTVNGKQIYINKFVKDDFIKSSNIYKIEQCYTNLQGNLVYEEVDL